MNDNASPSFSTEAATSMARQYGVEVRSNLGNVDGNANIALGFVFARQDSAAGFMIALRAAAWIGAVSAAFAAGCALYLIRPAHPGVQA